MNIRTIIGRVIPVICLAGALMGGASAGAGEGFLQIRNGYFWDPASSNYFVARGVAYQIWNPPVGANQSFEQLDYDLLEFKKMYANSVRGEFVWSQLEIHEGEFDWRKPDHLVAMAEKLGLKLFVIIGFQYPPDWFRKEWRGINNSILTSNVESNYLSDVLNYEHPEARRIYQRYITAVTGRYRDSRAIGAWILGNEYAYFDLWEDPLKYPVRRFLGFDSPSQTSFRGYLASVYRSNIGALNANWGTSYPDFDRVVMPGTFPPDYRNGAYHDLIQWRKKSIGDFVAGGAQAAKAADPNHLITYSMVGGIFNGSDANNTCEDGKTIVARCVAAGAPLDFWSINNYPWASIGSELRSADFGIGKYRAQTGLPIMISETGHSSTENLLGAGAAERQPKALPSTIWESLSSGAIGVHFFHWSDRNQYAPGSSFYREKGFGIVDQTRRLKQPVYDNVLETFRRMQDLRIDNLLGGSSNPPPDIQFFWSSNGDMTWPRANQENCMVWGALKRSGYQTTIIDDEQFERGDYTHAPALLLSRCSQMNPDHLDRIANQVMLAGIHVHANADLPGQVNAYQQYNANWAARMNSIFGLQLANASIGFETSPTNGAQYRTVSLKGLGNLGEISNNYAESVDTWKIWHGLASASGSTMVTHRGLNDSQPPIPALQIKNLGGAKSAINTFALGDVFGSSSAVHLWDFRRDWLRSIYRNHFGLIPAIDLTGPGAQYVMPNYRIGQNGSVILSLLNEHTNRATVTVNAPRLLLGRKVENLTGGGVLMDRSDGTVTVLMEGDGFVLLHAYDTTGQRDESLVNSNPNKLWFVSAPQAVWPKGSPYDVAIGYDTRDTNLTLQASIELVRSVNKIYGLSPAVAVKGQGTKVVSVPVPDADVNDPDYVSSLDGAEYLFHAWLETVGVRVSETFLPVRLLWGVHPVTPFPSAIVPGQTYPVTLEWQELPSNDPEDPTPLDRARLWESLAATNQHYDVVLELKAGDRLVASNSFVTGRGTGSHQFAITVPNGAAGPFTWSAHLQTAPNILSHDVDDSFEGRDRGALWPSNLTASFLAPWLSACYPSDLNLWQNAGVHLEGSDGSQSAFLVATNPPNLAIATGYLIYSFPSAWALPSDTNQWTNYVFACDFHEKNAHQCTLQLQIKSTNGQWLQVGAPYNPATNQWNTVRASLDQFVRPVIPGLYDYFDPQNVQSLVVLVVMEEPAVQYVISFDNIQFRGPEIDLGGGQQTAVYFSTNDVVSVLSIRKSGGGATISWTGAGTLQTTDQINGSWVDVPKAASPQTLIPTERQRFYRVRR